MYRIPDDWGKNAVLSVLLLADMRKHLADDEHRDPLPIYGSARLYDRIPLAERRNYTAIERLRLLREQMSPPCAGMLCYDGCGGYMNATNNEEGA